MNVRLLIYFVSFCRTHLIFLAICIQYDINKQIFLPINQVFSLWPANLEYLKNCLNARNQQLKKPITSTSSERPKQCFYRHYLVLIWSQLVLQSVAPEPVYVACRPNLKPTVPEPLKPVRNAAADDGRTCRSNRNRNCSNHFSSRPLTVNHLRWKRSTGLMKQPSGKKCRLPLSIGCSLEMAGRQKRTPNKGKHHECFGQILRLCFASYYLVYFVSCSAKCHCRRSYQRTYGGDF